MDEKKLLTGFTLFKTSVALEINPIITEKPTKTDANLVRNSCVVRLRGAKKGPDGKFNFKEAIRFNLGWLDLVSIYYGLVNKKTTKLYHETSKAGGEAEVVKTMILDFEEKYTGIQFTRKDTNQQVFFPLSDPEVLALSLIIAEAIKLNVYNHSDLAGIYG